ncbi:MAG: SDR family oxidoreductase [Planctomycetota bacterium]
MNRLEGKNIVITGGNSGIGRAAVDALVEQGAQVLVAGRDAASLEAVAEAHPGRVHSIVADVSKIADLDQLASEANSLFGGRVDALLVNAGVAKPAELSQTSEAFFDLHFDVNVKGALFTVQKFLPQLASGSSVVFTSSALEETGAPGMAVYAATKAAVRNFARSLAAELAPQGVRVNSIAPGPIETPIYDRMGLPQEAQAGFAEEVGGKVPLGRFGRPDEIAPILVYLASDESSYVTGSSFKIDGGFAAV